MYYGPAQFLGRKLAFSFFPLLTASVGRIKKEIKKSPGSTCLKVTSACQRLKRKEKRDWEVGGGNR